ncbi:MAG: PrsW family intramembrane metalloprotease [Candidatus Bathyarchaeia archaeon]
MAKIAPYERVICKGCGWELTWIPLYRRYYCYRCQAYPPTCSKCGLDLSWVPQYGRYFCPRCEEYPQPVEGGGVGVPVVQIGAATAFVGAAALQRYPFVLRAIDRFSIYIQKAVGGFPRQVLPKPPVIYANPQPPIGREARKYVAAGGVVSLFTSFVLFFASWLEQVGLFIFSFLGPSLYLLWVWKTDRYEREPRTYLFAVFALGFLAAIPAYILNSFVAGPLIGGLSAPIVEELLKGACVLWIAKKAEFNDSMDGVVYGFAAGMGFASAENFFYIVQRYEGDLLWSVLRVFVFGLGHGLYTSMAGRWIGRMKTLTGSVRGRFLLPGFVTASFMHFVYNEVAGAFLPLIGNIAWLIICLWILYAAVKHALAEERAWGYDKGLAPAHITLSAGQGFTTI